ncbi:hypothetical protein ACFWJ4_29960 [Kitasatospora sp. NPDC127067]|uniref:hypothetical protein n=1 Tax=Kitasatospora sp. NPDC127067 TaxID=3347126 RepID=UPI003660B601
MAAEPLFTAGDLARMRFAVSPLREVGPSLRLLRWGLARRTGCRRPRCPST